MMCDLRKYRLRFFFDFGSGSRCLWSDNPAARERFEYCVELRELSLSPETVAQAEQIGRWFDQSLNWEYPPNPGPWRQEECDRFNRAAEQLMLKIRLELGDEFDVVGQQ